MLLLTFMGVVPVAVRAGAPILTVTPNPIPVGFGQTGQARVSWDSGDGTVPEITMAHDTSPDVPVGDVVAPNGAGFAVPIAYGGVYLFKLWTPGRGRLLAATSVTTVRALSASAPSVANPRTTEIFDPPPAVQVSNFSARFVTRYVDDQTFTQPCPGPGGGCAPVNVLRISFDTWYGSMPSVALGIDLPNMGGRFPQDAQAVVLPAEPFQGVFPTHHEWLLWPSDYAYRTFAHWTPGYGNQPGHGYDNWDKVYISISQYDPYNIDAIPWYDKLSPKSIFDP
jgi:hypothetical protein